MLGSESSDSLTGVDEVKRGIKLPQRYLVDQVSKEINKPCSVYTTFFMDYEMVCLALQAPMSSYQDPMLTIVVKWKIWIVALKSRLNGIIR